MPPLRSAENKHGVYRKRISRRCLRRKLPFLPVPGQAFMKNLVNQLGDESLLFYSSLVVRDILGIGYENPKNHLTSRR